MMHLPSAFEITTFQLSTISCTIDFFIFVNDVKIGVEYFKLLLVNVHTSPSMVSADIKKKHFYHSLSLSFSLSLFFPLSLITLVIYLSMYLHLFSYYALHSCFTQYSLNIMVNFCTNNYHIYHNLQSQK